MKLLTEDDFCLHCLDELRRGIPADGKCGHEALRARDKRLREERDAAYRRMVELK
jgi:hypothetical protein